MKKRVYLMTAISAVVVALTACGGNAGNNKSSSATSASGSAVSSNATGTAIEFNPADYIEKLADYKGLEYTKQDVSATDAEVEEKVKSFLEAYPEKITDRAVQKGDTVNIDFEGKKDGVAFDGGTAKGFDLTIGSNSFIPGFEDGLIGKKPGETVDLNLKFPDDYKNSEELKGAKVVFTVKVNYIVGKVPTELTDELVKANTEFKTAVEYKDDARKKIETRKNDEAKEIAQRELLEKVVTTSAIKSVPKVAEEKYYNQVMDYWKNIAANYGMEFKDLVQKQLKLTEEEFEKEVKNQAELSAKLLVVVRAIAKAEKIDISDEEYNTALKTYYESSNVKDSMDIAAYESQVGKENIMDVLLNDKVGAFLVENGKAISK